MTAVEAIAPSIGTAPACRALGVARASVYRRRRPRPPRQVASAPRKSARSLSRPERQAVLDVLHSERFADQAPAEVYATLLDEGIYLCSTRTMYRLLEEADEVRERRNQLRHPAYSKPELLATRPNEVWSWDITKLLGPKKWTYYHAYVIIDIFSRYVVGWTVACREDSNLAERLIAETCRKQGVARGTLTLHADRGTSMTSKPVAFLLADLGVTKTHSRPHTSSDNPFSESHFKTMKYCPRFPDRFTSIEHARKFFAEFVAWYNQQHHHSGLGLMTPHAVHHGQVAATADARQATLDAAYLLHPERFVGGQPRASVPPAAVWINPPTVTPNPQHERP
jgi:putative transposase